MPKMKRPLSMTVYLLALIAGIFLTRADFAPAHNLDEHIKIWEKVFGLEPKQSILNSFWEEASNVLDRYQEAEEELKENFPWYKNAGGPRYHRLLFHWGFNVDPKEHEPLRKHIEEKYDEYRETLISEFHDGTAPPMEELKRFTLFETLPAQLYSIAIGTTASALEAQEKLGSFIDERKWEQMELFWDVLREYQGWSDSSTKNRTLIESVEDLLHLDGRPARGLATLIYDIHVLADYQTSQVDQLGDLSLLKKDIAELGVQRLVGPPTWARYKPMFDRLKFGWDDHDPEHAEKLMKVLEQIMPEILHSLPYRDLLERRGIKLKDIQSPYKEAA